ncbi:LOB domain-containing protein 22 [Sesamum angolense]|uniref:LOB domain-containing protein 22 n=1 Tax=Sesamum angolense TaxID=2727404 RepID=A0AAE2BRP7_9LAMI|nr:LOB domain-containing protein 22 [Sesamum angolense]
MHSNKKSNITSITNNNNNTKRTTSVPLSHPRSHGSTTQACAACKYQRRKCASDCILAPYFPHDRQRQFLNAHRLFGVSNIVKIVRHLDPPAKDHAMRTIIFQSDARAADPVGGCHRIIRDLEQRISLANAELEIVLHHLALCRAAATQQQVVPAPDGGDSYDEKWTVPYVAENEAVTVDDVNSWGCMPGNVHANAESTSSSFPHHNNYSDHHHMRKLSVEECNNDVLPILDHLTCDDDVREDEFKFDHHGNIVPRSVLQHNHMFLDLNHTNSQLALIIQLDIYCSSNGILTEEKGTFKEDDDCFSYVQDHHDLKAAATFFSLTNCDI